MTNLEIYLSAVAFIFVIIAMICIFRNNHLSFTLKEREWHIEDINEKNRRQRVDIEHYRNENTRLKVSINETIECENTEIEELNEIIYEYLIDKLKV